MTDKFPINNQDKLLDLIALFQEHGGYWFLDQSEESNMEIKWCPFIGDGKGKFLPAIHQKRVYDISDFHKRCLEEIAPYV